MQAVDVPPESATGGLAFVGFTLALMGSVNAFKSLEAKSNEEKQATEMKALLRQRGKRVTTTTTTSATQHAVAICEHRTEIDP